MKTSTAKNTQSVKSINLRGIFAALAFIICFVLVQSASAATYTVINTNDSGTGSLRAAIASANSTATNDTIKFAIPAGSCTAGVCTITLTSGELVINSAATAGTLMITNSTGASKLLISGNNSSRVFFVNAGANLMISGVTITKGNGAGTTNSGKGGGIYNRGSLALTSSTVSGNTASSQGGGIFNAFGSTATLTLTSSTVSGNTASVQGGGILNEFGATTTLTNSSVSGNMADNGGGINNQFGGTTTLTNSSVSGNMAQFGGGIINFGTMTLTNLTVSSNTASNQGGGIFNSSITFTLTNSTVSGNTAVSGGGIFINSGSLTTLTNSTVSGNTADNGGGILDNGGTLNLTSVTVTQNKLTGAACTFCAGGITNLGTANLKNTIVAVNTVANSSSSPDFRGAVATGSSYNLIGNGQGTTGISNGDANQNQVGVDPKLDPTLQLNGGTTANHALLAGSPAIDKGNSFGLTTDQRGFTRPFDNPSITNATGGDGSDIGAFEVQAAPTAASVTIGGRVMTESGRGIRNVWITLTDSSGNVRTATTTAFGYYRFADVAAGETYIITAKGKRFAFTDQIRTINVTGDIDDVNFIAY